jgi:lipopolysaccharide biosynthesis protein
LPLEHQHARRPYVRSDERAIGYVPYAKGELPDPLPATLVAFYLPQFHTIPENDEWWGKGFTEWRNVTRALPQFEGHHQPRLPGDLGFYDLRNPEVMREQARLAKEYGIGAFCFYFYWFGGETLLETPLRNWLADRTIDFPFCLCWANEKWTRTWDGRGDEILIDQKHSAEDDLAFIAYVSDYLRDPRYLRVDDRPLLLVYRPDRFPDIAATVRRWRDWCRANNIGELHLSYVQSFERPTPFSMGLDSAVQFPPNMAPSEPALGGMPLINPDYKGRIFDWRRIPAHFSIFPHSGYRLFPGINVSWDNEARRSGGGTTFVNSSPFRYENWLRSTVDWVRTQKSDNLIFINAWNEWAEGAVLEPDATSGYAYLASTRASLGFSQSASTMKTPVVVIHGWHIDALTEILDQLSDSGLPWKMEVSTTPDKETAVQAILRSCGFQYRIHTRHNRGRDMLPFLHIAQQLLQEGEDFVLKLHTKRSLHRTDGDRWRRELITALISGTRAQAAIEAFANNSRLGLVAPHGHVQPMSYFWGANADHVLALARRLGLNLSTIGQHNFISGSMFWLRLSAIRPLLEIGLHVSDFEPEEGQVDGTMAHALERILAPSVTAEGWEMLTSGQLMGVGKPHHPSSYSYARSSN